MCGAGWSSGRKGLPWLDAPWTPIELTNTKRLTPERAASRASATVNRTFVSRKASAAWCAGPEVTCARAAQCTKAVQPDSPRCHTSASRIEVTPMPRPHPATDAGFRTNASTAWPAPTSRSTIAVPTNPLAPLTAIFFKFCGPRMVIARCTSGLRAPRSSKDTTMKREHSVAQDPCMRARPSLPIDPCDATPIFP